MCITGSKICFIPEEVSVDVICKHIDGNFNTSVSFGVHASVALYSRTKDLL